MADSNGRYKRRSSLFRQNAVEEEEEEDCRSYPPNYSEKLKSEIENLITIATDVNTEKVNTIAGYKSKMKNTKILSEVKLSKEQEDFLASLPDLDNYVEKVTKFCDKIKIAVEITNLSKEMKDREIERELQLNNERIGKLLDKKK